MFSEMLNQNRTVVISTGLVVLVIAGYFIAHQSFSPPMNSTPLPNTAFFSTDDGASFFKASISNPSPFIQDGKQAVRAFVFTCDGGKHQFVGYLEKTDGKNLVKKPGTGEWVPESSNQGTAVVTPRCPDGTGGLVQQVPP